MRVAETRTILAAFAAVLVAATGARSSDILWEETKRYSFGHEEVIIRDFFGDERDGFFVDVGCAYPKKASNTFYLEKHLGWTGLGVDGLPGYAKGWKQLRPGSTFLNYLVTDHAADAESFYKVAVGGLSTAEEDVAKRRGGKEIKVPAITLDALLEQQGVDRVDLLSIDVEGHHEEVLGGFDLARWKPRLVCIEETGFYAVPWFKARGYAPIMRYRAHDIVNWYFAPSDQAGVVDARSSAAEKAALEKRRLMLEAEPPGSPLRAIYTPLVVLDPHGTPIHNPDRSPPPGALRDEN